ncbi:helix-turn-helix transcriptional regulator [Amycolatopsis sp. QT-25]|uniref:helix-turn-helix domain-containing protein n=1 Tax=Amycolatopsis sp. QT-25 TaxID=3034022 RepID=UPI0023EDC834|nr:helix-turn-helix transcriptional regulator [Amycolatopsis sp. QT-25]WET79267.1 helix-turn-helix transcriptional regulator [Amycolatopsis sp. QT-25]
MTTTPNKLHAERVRHRMAELGIRDAKQLAALSGIPYGTLRNAVAGRDPMRLDRIYVIAQLLRRPHDASIRDVVDDILATNAPPDAPSTKTATGPRRNNAGVAA